MERPPHSERWWVKIGDFGISKRAKNGETALRTEAGTILFQAPEISGFVGEDIESSTYTHAVDLWSLGCLVYNLAAQCVPFLKPSHVNSFCQERLKFPEAPLHPRMHPNGIEFVQCLLVPKPAHRLSAENALQHPGVLTRPTLTTHNQESIEDLQGPLADVPADQTIQSASGKYSKSTRGEIVKVNLVNF